MSLQVMNRVWSDQKTTGSHRLALLALADRADEDGICWPGVQWIAQRTNVSDRQIRTILRDLEESGHLLTIGGKGGRSRTNLYTVIAGLTPADIDDIFARRKDIERVNPEVQRSKPGSPAHKPGSPAHKPGSPARINPEVQRSKPGSPAHKPGSPARINPEVQRINPEVQRINPEVATSGEPVDPINPQLEPPVVAVAAAAAAAETQPVVSQKPKTVANPTRNRKTDPEWHVLCTTYENEIGLLTPILVTELTTMADKYPADWITDAIAEAVKSNVRNLKYASAILLRWHTEGRNSNVGRNPGPTTYQSGGKSQSAHRNGSPTRRDNGVPVPEEPTEAEWERIDALLAGKPWPPVAQPAAG